MRLFLAAALAAMLLLPASAMALDTTVLDAPKDGSSVKPGVVAIEIAVLSDYREQQEPDVTLTSPTGVETTLAVEYDDTSFTYKGSVTAKTAGVWKLDTALYCGFDYCGDDESSYAHDHYTFKVLPPPAPAGSKPPVLRSVKWGFTPKGCRYGCEKTTLRVCGHKGRLVMINDMRYTAGGDVDERSTVRKRFYHAGGCATHVVTYARPNNQFGAGLHVDSVHVENVYGQKSATRRRSVVVED